MTVKCKYTITNCDQGNSKFGQGKSGKNQGICFLKLCGHPEFISSVDTLNICMKELG